MIKKINTKKGFSLLEILLAISIFSLSVMGLSMGIIYGEQSSVRASNRAQATLLANEGIEASRNIALDDFDELVDGVFGLSILSDTYVFSGSSDTWDIYDRQITISSVDANTKQVVSRISWQDNASNYNDLELVTYLTNWK